jgi:hypothetical protein
MCHHTTLHILPCNENRSCTEIHGDDVEKTTTKGKCNRYTNLVGNLDQLDGLGING